MLFNRHVVTFRPNTNLVIPGYLAIVLSSKYIQQQILSFTTGAVIRYLMINNLGTINIPIPEMAIQEKIFLEFNNSFKESLNKVGSLKSRIVKYENEIDQMFNDIIGL